MPTVDYHYELPAELIAQTPAPKRDGSRLLVLNRATGSQTDATFTQFPALMHPGDTLVLNNSKVIPARLRGANAQTGGTFEILLIEELTVNDWWVLLRPGKRAQPGTRINLLKPEGQPAGLVAMVTEVNPEGHRRLAFSGTPNIAHDLDRLGEVPLPPYINRTNPGEPGPDRDRYQTVYAAPPGSVAAPTAGLHFTPQCLEELRQRGINLGFVTLHVGPGTFAPVKVANPAEHVMHSERFELGTETAALIQQTRAAGRRVFAGGTTTVRVLETVAARNAGQIIASAGKTDIFIYPPYRFQVVDALLTNFHLPESTLLMLVSAFAAPGEDTGRERILTAYRHAVRECYRFFSYGDAMLIL